MEKGLKYVNTYKPIQINDLESQKALWDRRKIYEILKENNIPMAKHFFVERKCQRPIDQDYLESYAKQTKNRGDYLIRYAQEQREIFEKSKTSNP